MRCLCCQNENREENFYYSQCGLKLPEKLQDVQAQKGGVDRSTDQGKRVYYLCLWLCSSF